MATPPSSDSAHPRDKEVVLYSEVNVNEVLTSYRGRDIHSSIKRMILFVPVSESIFC